jgi:3-phenylpropionate/cinnamic acid dioxygenase small subunit
VSRNGELEAFVYREARLMDELELDQWLALWTEDGVYQVPAGAELGAKRQVAIINDDYVRLRQRVDRLKTGSVLAVEGARGAMRRIVSNIEVEAEDEAGEMEVASNFILAIARSAEQQLWIGRTIHRLRRIDGDLRIARKTVLLINRSHEMPLLQFLI